MNNFLFRITHVLDPETILYVKEQDLWPERFQKEAQALTRESKRNVKTTDVIDEDMLPPSDSSSDTGDDDSNASDEGEESVTCNPNRR